MRYVSNVANFIQLAVEGDEMQRMRGKASAKRPEREGAAAPVLQRAVPHQGVAAGQSPGEAITAASVELMKLLMHRAAELGVAVTLIASELGTGHTTISGNTYPGIVANMVECAHAALREQDFAVMDMDSKSLMH